MHFPSFNESKHLTSTATQSPVGFYGSLLYFTLSVSGGHGFTCGLSSFGLSTHDDPLDDGIFPSLHCSHFPSVVYLSQSGIVTWGVTHCPFNGTWPAGQVFLVAGVAGVHFPSVPKTKLSLHFVHFPVESTVSQLSGNWTQALLTSW